MTTFHLTNFGCRASQADGAAIKKHLLDAGLSEAASTGESDVAVLNTCTVTASADAEVRQMVRRIRRANPRCRILVTGCYAQRAPEEISRLDGVAWVVGNSHKHLVTEILGTGVGNSEAKCGAQGAVHTSIVNHQSANPSPPTLDPRPLVLVGEVSPEFHFAPVFADDRTRPTLKVQDGCDARCSFCIIPEVRGRSRSLDPERVIEQVRDLERQGYKEVVLSGINLGRYGRDLGGEPGGGITFLGLVQRILAETTIPRIRISSIEPMDVSPDLVRLVGRERRCADHFHVPLQSGSDRILRLMNRRYWTKQYAERILAIRQSLPNAAIGADVMVGFPGETGEDHAQSLRFIESLPFTYLHIFPYSARPGTPAAARPDQVNGRLAHERSQEIRQVMARKRAAFLEAQVGRTLSALTLGAPSSGSPVALSSNYLAITLPASDLAPNTLVNVQVGRAQAGMLCGYPA
ncbi:MAG TPA: tRNA (N(6)-L-threonylcarbamoyladenosine(37)-C(2))-methylthiotransferase MtaB [Terriglobia bacterium]|nr:tRNA (N(6)-L-threonylcarbamoyladenosine(37)-C(2))-methylthiotransferase MtaB [Terriglobia bacterium]